MTYEKVPEIVEYFKVLNMDKSKHTLTSYKNAIDKFLDFTQFSSLQEIEQCDSSIIRNFQKYLQTDMPEKKKIDNSSINTIMRPLKALMNWMISEENKYATQNPFVGIKALKTRKKIQTYMTEEEVNKLFSSMNDFEDKTIFALYLTTGLRREELATLKLSDFNGERIKALGKGNKEADIALMPEVIDMLYMYIDWRNKKYGNKDEHIFISKYNKQYSGGAIYYKFKTALKNAKFSEDRIDELHPHSMRHTFCANVGEHADIYTLQKAMRHSNMATTTIYMHMKDKKLDNAILSQKIM